MKATQRTSQDTEDLIQTQLRLEEEMTKKGAEAFLRYVQQSKERGDEAGTNYGMTILKARIDTLAKAIEAWIVEMSSGRAGNNAVAYRKVKEMSPDTLAFLTLKNIVAGISTVRTLHAVAVSIGTAIEDELRLADARKKDERQYSSIVSGAKKRSSDYYKHVYAVRRLNLMEDGWDEWSRTDCLHVGVRMIDLCMASTGIVEITNAAEGDDGTTKFLKPTPALLEWIDKKTTTASMLRPVYEPMVVPPRNWTTPFDGGYISTAIKPLRLVKSSNKAYLEELTNADMPIVYEAVNALQQTAWQINTQLLDIMRKLWEGGSELAGLPRREGLDMPRKPDGIEEDEALRKAYREEANAVHLLNLQGISKRVSFSHTLDIARRYSQYRRIYMPYTLDFRGRIYAVPHLNPQGNDIQKALLRFANGKPLGDEGAKWLAVHGANVIGNDKCSFEDRVQFILDNEEELLACAENPYDNRGWCTEIGGFEVDKPWQTLAFCMEWAGFMRHGESYVSKIPVALDGSCSGIQHFSAMLRDEIGGAAVNLTPSDVPADVYALVAKKVLEQIEQDILSGTEDELKHYEDKAYVKRGTKILAQQWKSFGVTRKVTKRSVMTLAYGSQEYGFREQLMEDIIGPARFGGGPFPFDGTGFQAACYMAKCIWHAVNKVLVKAGEAMEWLQAAAGLLAQENLPVRWTTPVGFPVMQAYPDTTRRTIGTAISGVFVRFVEHRQDGSKLNTRKQRNGISPNFVHSVDAAHLMLTTVRAQQGGIKSFAMIHDSFGALASDIGGRFGMYHAVRSSFIEMYRDVDILEAFRVDVAGHLSSKLLALLPPTPTHGSLEVSSVLDSRYCFS